MTTPETIIYYALLCIATIIVLMLASITIENEKKYYKIISYWCLFVFIFGIIGLYI